MKGGTGKRSVFSKACLGSLGSALSDTSEAARADSVRRGPPPDEEAPRPPSSTMPTPQSQLGAASDSSCSKATSRPEATFSVSGAALELSALKQPRLGTNDPTRPPDIASPLAVSSSIILTSFTCGNDWCSKQSAGGTQFLRAAPFFWTIAPETGYRPTCLPRPRVCRPLEMGDGTSGSTNLTSYAFGNDWCSKQSAGGTQFLRAAPFWTIAPETGYRPTCLPRPRVCRPLEVSDGTIMLTPHATHKGGP